MSFPVDALLCRRAAGGLLDSTVRIFFFMQFILAAHFISVSLPQRNEQRQIAGTSTIFCLICLGAGPRARASPDPTITSQVITAHVDGRELPA